MELKDNFTSFYFEKMYGNKNIRKQNLLNIYGYYLKKCNDQVCNGIFVDIGTGRGEMLELFEELFPNLICTGIDKNDVFEKNISKNSDFYVLDAIEYLDATFNEIKCITCINVIEYMKPDYLIKFIDLCRKRIEFNGILIIESNTIYFPGYEKLYPLSFITAILEFVGFRDVNVIHNSDNSYILIATN